MTSLFRGELYHSLLLRIAGFCENNSLLTKIENHEISNLFDDHLNNQFKNPAPAASGIHTVWTPKCRHVRSLCQRHHIRTQTSMSRSKIVTRLDRQISYWSFSYHNSTFIHACLSMCCSTCKNLCDITRNGSNNQGDLARDCIEHLWLRRYRNECDVHTVNDLNSHKCEIACMLYLNGDFLTTVLGHSSSWKSTTRHDDPKHYRNTNVAIASRTKPSPVPDCCTEFDKHRRKWSHKGNHESRPNKDQTYQPLWTEDSRCIHIFGFPPRKTWFEHSSGIVHDDKLTIWKGLNLEGYLSTHDRITAYCVEHITSTCVGNMVKCKCGNLIWELARYDDTTPFLPMIQLNLPVPQNNVRHTQYHEERETVPSMKYINGKSCRK